jgi:acyl carrier protein
MERELEFIEKMADILECEPEEISFDTDFREEIEDWDSLKGFSMLILFEEDYDKKMSVNEFLNCKKIKNLYDAVCV